MSMYCSSCGNKLLDNDNFCNNCGEASRKNSGAKSTSVEKDTSIVVSKAHPSAVKKFKQDESIEALVRRISISRNRFLILSFATFSLYELVWSYRVWKLVKLEKNLKISPFWRAFFIAFWTGSLAKNVKNVLNEKEYSLSINYTFIGISYFVLFILWQLPDPWWLISFLTVFIMLPITQGFREYREKAYPDVKEHALLWWHKLLIAVGLILFAYTLFASVSCLWDPYYCGDSSLFYY